MKLDIKRLTADAKLPAYGSASAAGMDLYSAIDAEIPPQSRKVIGTGIAMKWSNDSNNDRDDTYMNMTDYYMRIAPRSGLSVKSSIDIGAGVIDSDYRGEIMICVINHSLTDTFKIQKKDKIAQMILTRIDRPNITEYTNEWNAAETERGEGGFGSTGTR